MHDQKDKVIIVDIDGILVDYPTCFLDWVKVNTGKAFGTIQDMKNETGLESYEIIKEQYRQSGIKRMLQPKQVFCNICNMLYEAGIVVFIVTKREKREPIIKDTIHWLDNNLHYDAVFFVKDKIEFMKSIGGCNIIGILDDNLTDLLG